MKLKITWKDITIILLDIAAVNLSYIAALYIRFWGLAQVELLHLYLADYLRFAPFYTVLCIVIFALNRLYSGMWKYAGMHDLNRIIFASIATCAVHIAGTLLFIKEMPVTYYFLGAVFQFAAICVIRLGYRVVRMERAKITRHSSPAENVMIIGHDGNVKKVMEYLENNETHNFRPVCIIDDKARQSGCFMNGVPVIGGTDQIEYGIEKYRVRNVYIANPLLDNEVRNRLEEICKERYLVLKDYAGYLMYLDHDDGLLQIVKAPITMKVSGSEKRIIPFSPPDMSEQEIGEVTEALKSGWITTGPRTKMLERRLAAFIETGRTDIDTEENPDRWMNRAVCLNSGTAAEELNLRILGVGPGDEVIVPAYTYTATASAVIHCGAKPVFVDIRKDGDPLTHMPEMDYAALEQAITEKTKAVVVVDLGGIPADYDRVFEIVERKKALFTPLKSDGTPLGDFSGRIQRALGRAAVLADSAHSLGAKRIVGGAWKYCGRMADFTSFSFHAVKNFTTAEGGASAWLPIKGIDDAELYKFYQLLSLHGQSKDALAKAKVDSWEYDIIGPWFKYNMTDIMAAIGLRQLDRYKGLLERRERIISRYDAVCDELGIRYMVHHTRNMDSVGHLYLIRIPGIGEEQRNRIIEKMAGKGVATNVHYKPLPMMTAYGKDCSGYPNAYDYYRNLISLPLHTLLSDDDVEYVCGTLREAIQEALGR